MADITLDQYYPTGAVLGQITEAAGGDVADYDQYAAGGVAEQLRVLVDPDMTLDQYTPGGVAEQVTVVLEEGGSGAPEWVPADAKIHIDLVNNRAWTEADGEVEIDTLLGSDPLSGNAWDSTSYNPEALTASGYNNPGNAVGAIGALKAFLQAGGFTGVVRWLYETGGGLLYPSTTADADGSFYITIGAESNGDVSVEDQDDTQITFSAVLNEGTPTSFNAFAFTLTADRFDAAVNGSDPETFATAFTKEFFLFQPFGSDANFWTSLTIYDALPDTTGLSELSET